MVLETYLTMSKLLSNTSFTFAEQQLILLTASAHNGCKYCVAAHSSGARMAKLDRDAIDAVREGRPAEDTKLEALRCFVEEVMETRGKVSEQTINQFLDTGYNETQVMELMIGLAMKTLSNTFARMFGTPLEALNAKMEGTTIGSNPTHPQKVRHRALFTWRQNFSVRRPTGKARC